MVLRLWSAIVLTALLLSGCGGGGGSGGGGDGFSVSYDRSSVSLSFDEGSAPPQATVIATAHGTTPSKVFIGASTPSGQPDPNIDHVEVLVNGKTGATVNVIPSANLSAGTYSGTIVLLVCADNACATHYSGSPFNLSYSFTVKGSIRATPGSIYFNDDAGKALSQYVTVTLPSGVASYTATVTAGEATIDQLTTAGFRVTVPAGAPGTYASTITLAGGGLQRKIDVQHVANPRQLKLDQTSLTLSAVSGSTASAAVAVTQLTEGQTSFTASAGSGPWLTLSDTTASGFKVNAASLPSGTYYGTVTVQSGGTMRTVSVTYVVTAPAGGDVYFNTTASSLTFAAAQGVVTSAQGIGLTRPSWNPTVTPTIAYVNGRAWLSTSTGPSGDMQFTASAVGLAKGVYRADVTLSAAYPSTSRSLSVAFTVGDGLATPAAQSVVMTSESTAASLKGTIPVVANGAASVEWTASSSASWLVLTTASGSLGTPIAYQVDTTAALALPAFTDQQATVTINAQIPGAPAGSAGFTPVTTTVTLRRELAEVHYVGPGNIVSGKAATVIVRGRGFDHLTSPASRLSIAGVTPTSVTRTSATSLSVVLPALASGDRNISISNALGTSTSTTALHVLDALAHGATAMPTGGVARSVIYDPVRRTAYVANKSLSAIQRFREGSGGWTMDTLALPSLGDIALSPDGAVLVAS